jgi:pilus assembly protein CpaF
VVARLEALAALGGLDRPALHSQLAAAVQVVLHMHRHRGGGRRLAGIGVLVRDDDAVRVRPAWQVGEGWTTAGRATLRALLRRREVSWPC